MILDKEIVKKVTEQVEQDILEEEKVKEATNEQTAIEKSKFIKFCLDSGINLLTAKEYRSQLRKFLRDYRVDDNGKIGGVDNDTALVDRMVRFCNDARRVYNRRYAMKKALDFWDKSNNLIGSDDPTRQKVPVIIAFSKKTKGLKLLPRRLLKKSLSMDEYRKLTSELPELYSLVLRIMFETAYRISPVLHLERSHISIEGGRIKLIVKEKGDRIITAYLSKDTSRKLANWINNNQIKKGLIFNVGYKIFEPNLKKYGQDILNRDISTHFGKVSRAMYEFGERETDVRKVQQILHHKDIKTTLVYLQESGLDSKKEIEAREKDLMWGE